MNHKRPSLKLQQAIQRTAVNELRLRRHAAYTAWHFEDKRRGILHIRPMPKEEGAVMACLIVAGCAIAFGLILASHI